ncbi:MAG: hypothetical protein ACO2OX_04185 [Candidatus Nanopusillus sp.]|jgi:hypothetical protein
MEFYKLLQESFKDNIELLLKLEKMKDLLNDPKNTLFILLNNNIANI